MKNSIILAGKSVIMVISHVDGFAFGCNCV